MNTEIAAQNTLIESAEKLSSGPLAPEHELYLKNLVAECNGKVGIEFRHPSQEILEVSPKFYYEFYIPEYNYWYVYQPWFETLSDDERRFIFGLRLLTTTDPKTIQRRTWFVKGSIIAIEVVISYGLYKILQPFNLSTVITFGIILAFVILLEKLVLDRCEAALANNVRWIIQRDCAVAQRLNCHQGAISVLEKLQHDIKPRYELDKKYWQGLYTTFDARIKALKASQ